LKDRWHGGKRVPGEHLGATFHSSNFKISSLAGIAATKFTCGAGGFFEET